MKTIVNEPKLSIDVKSDGVWLHFKPSTGKEAMLNLNAIYDDRKTIVGAAIAQWCDEFAAADKAYKEKRKPPIP